MERSTRPANDIPSHAAMLMRWHGLGPEYIPSVAEALNAWGLPELETTEQDVQAAYMSLEAETASGPGPEAEAEL